MKHFKEHSERRERVNTAVGDENVIDNLQPRIIMQMEKIFSYSVKADTLPKPTLVIHDSVK